MRITNQMISNKMMLNINRNARKVDTIYNKLATGDNIQVPSDDPIVAARILKFRTSLSETAQYKRNVDQAMSWMEISESGFMNAIDVMDQIRYLCVSAASDVPYTAEDRKKISDQINQLVEQLGVEMNVPYAGRYVFSGYRTDEPPAYTANSNMSYQITQSFFLQDIDVTKAYQKIVVAAAPPVPDDVLVTETNIIRLAYTGLQNVDVNLTVNGTVTGSFGTVNTVSITDPNAYKPAAGVLNYLSETGELVINDADMASLAAVPGGGISVTYEKTGFYKGELNPLVYFPCTDLNTGKSYNMDTQAIEYEFGNSTRIGINSLAKNVVTANLYADLKDIVFAVTNVSFTDEADLRKIFSAQGLSGTDLENAVAEQVRFETQQTQGFLQNKYSQMLELCDKHMNNLSKEHADLGSRMYRLEMIKSRLEDDEISYNKLLAANADVDYMEAIMLLNTAESIYNAALQTGARIIQTSLVNFLA